MAKNTLTDRTRSLVAQTDDVGKHARVSTNGGRNDVPATTSNGNNGNSLETKAISKRDDVSQASYYLPNVLKENFDIYCRVQRKSKTEVLRDIIANFLKDQGMDDPYKPVEIFNRLNPA